LLSIDEGFLDRITERFHFLLKGRIPSPLEIPADMPDDELRQLATYVNRFLEQYAPFARAMEAVSEGRLDVELPRGQMAVVLAYKALQSNLRHLTFKTQRIASGGLEETVDFMGEFSHAFNSMTQQLRDSFAAIEERNRVIEEEKERSDRLLLNVLPAQVADELKATGTSEPQSFEDVTVLFSDLVGFTKISASIAPHELIAALNAIFTRFDEIMDRHGCERIKTIGDAYLAVCGMPEPNPDHARTMVAAAVEMMGSMRRHAAWPIRIGVHSGPLVGGIVGVKKYIYDVFGDTINTASRMETMSEPMRINVSEATRELAGDDFRFVERDPVEVKGKGAMRMYFVEA
jgi:class 3 adenylate cyclase/HAMP domain-containing protein